MALFPEEKKLMEELVDEWYVEIHKVTMEADGIFGEKGKLYDVNDPVWTRAEWPYGFVHEINKKANRVKQLMSGVTEVNGFNVRNIREANEELGDIQNYARMFHALSNMLIERSLRRQPPDVQQIPSADQLFCGYCGEAECDCEADPSAHLREWPAQRQIQPGETRIVNSENPLYAREGETEAQYRKRLEGTFDADGNEINTVEVPF